MEWTKYYRKYYDGEPLEEFFNKYKLHEQQERGPELTEEGYRIFGFNIMILGEDGYTIIQEGFNEYGLLQDFNDEV